MSCNNVQILNFNHNIVEVGPDNKIVITDQVKCNSITIPQPVTNILQINSPGPQGPVGAGGGGSTFPYTGDAVITGSLVVTGSLNITGSLKQNGYEVKPYKVFSALVTQENGSDSNQYKSSGAVTKGVTYLIIDSSDGDFSNVGAPNNNINTYFIATNSNVPNSYGTSQLRYNAAVPTAIVLENTIGNVWFDYGGQGIYRLNSNNLFTDEKTMVIGSSYYQYQLNTIITFSSRYQRGVEDTILLQTFSGTSAIDGYLNNTPLEIRVYN